MRRLRMLVEIERQAGFGPITCLFVVVFLLCSLAVWLTRSATACGSASRQFPPSASAT